MKHMNHITYRPNGCTVRWMFTLFIVISLIIPAVSVTMAGRKLGSPRLGSRRDEEVGMKDDRKFSLSHDMDGGAASARMDDVTAVTSGPVTPISWPDRTPSVEYVSYAASGGRTTTTWPKLAFAAAAAACFSLTLGHTGNGSTPVASPTKSAECTTNGQFVAGQAISLSGAAPDAGWQIGGWTGAASNASMANTNSLTMPANAQSVAVNYGRVTVGNWLSIFQGIEEATGHTTVAIGSGNQVVHALRIDLQNPNIRLFTTPPIANYQAESRETAGLKTSEFLVNYGLQVAINANYFRPCCSQLSGSPMVVEGLAISDGNLVSAQEDADFASAMLFSSTNVPTMIPTNWPAASTVGVANAVTGKFPLVVNGINVASNGPIHPRTAIGYSLDKRYLIVMTIDGRQPGYSDGAEDINTAEWMIRLGVSEAVNLDGGGSTTLVVTNGHGGANVVNRPIHNNVPGSERVVANHLGVYALPLCYALTLSHTGQGSDPVATPAKSIACATDGQYVASESIALSGATPDTGWRIGSWTGAADNNSTANTNSLTMPASAHTASVNYVQPPSQPTLVAPADASFDQSTAPQLTVQVSDPDADALSVSFYGREVSAGSGADFTTIALSDTRNDSAGTPATYTLSHSMDGTASFINLGTVYGVASSGNASMMWSGLKAGTKYEWYVTIGDGTATTTGPHWFYTTADSPKAPAMKTINITGVSNEDVTLTWDAVPLDVKDHPTTITAYRVYGSHDPFFDPGVSALLGEPTPPTATTFTHTGGSTGTINWYYLVRAVNVVGESANSGRRTGRFGFTLAPGTAP